ncbi:type I inositol polyphosphate 5-phosphatase 5 isoform X2 [Mercurialis annua]|nr:type I inositol polyphosphate 5-phosphatase 5 isoform X2 [Mercurialis annua]
MRNGKERGSSDELESDGDDIFFDFDRKITEKNQAFIDLYPNPMKKNGIKDRVTSPAIEGLNLCNFEQSMAPETEIKEFRIFVGTWNVGGKTPNSGLNLEDFLQVEGCADIYVCGFQEIVPLSAGNVLVIEDNEPAAKWLALINHALNKPRLDPDSPPNSRLLINHDNIKDTKPHKLFNRNSLKVLSKSLKVDSSLIKVCNCPVESPPRERHRLRKLNDCINKLDPSSSPEDDRSIRYSAEMPILPCAPTQMSYSLITSKKMVGIFVSVWVRRELVPHVGHLRISSVGRGIMGCLGNKGCISVSLTLHKTSLCFVCCHLASGEKEGDELRRNADVAEIIRSTQFPKICKSITNPRAPERIIDHDRVIWLGDLNYRVALSYEETRVLLEDNEWDKLLEKDQLNIEREAGRVFNGFTEGRILFAPTYKYSNNSDSYAGETVKSRKKRRTPAWCDRILWKGKGIEQLSYIRSESRFSDHRPVCAVFAVEVEAKNRNYNRFRKGYSCASQKMDYDDCIPQRHSFYGV